MANKLDLISVVLAEFEVAQREAWTPPKPGQASSLTFPPLLPTGTTKLLPATDRLLESVNEFASLELDDRPVLRPALKDSEWLELVRRCFGRELDQRDQKQPLTPSDFCAGLQASIDGEVDNLKRDISLVLGCWLFEDPTLYPIAFGPIHFNARQEWLSQTEASGELSAITVRRLRRSWRGEKLRNRSSSSRDGWRERTVSDAVGGAPIVCTVRTHGLSPKLRIEKGVLAARLAMSSLSLMWERPSQGLEWMNLQYDGDVYNRRHSLFSDGRFIGGGSAISRLPAGYNDSGGKVRESLQRFQPLLDQLGECIAAYIRPDEQTRRPRLMNALFLSLWWFHQGCREGSDQMAVTKFAASLDALAGGTRAQGIIELVEAQLGFQPLDPVLKDKRNSKQVIERIYNAGRSRLIHGSSDDFGQDWGSLRSTAESLSRHCIVQVCHSLTLNPANDDIRALRQPST